MDLAVQVALGDPRGRYVFKNVSLAQTSVNEQVNPDTLVRTEDLEVVRLFDGRDETPHAGDFQFLGLMIVGVLRESRFEVIDERVIVVANLPQEFSLVCQLLEMLVRDSCAVERDIERRVQQREPEVQRNYFGEQRETSLDSLLKTVEMNDRPVREAASVFRELLGVQRPRGYCCGFKSSVMASSSAELSITPPIHDPPLTREMIVIVAHDRRASLPMPFLPMNGRPAGDDFCPPFRFE